MGINTNN